MKLRGRCADLRRFSSTVIDLRLPYCRLAVILRARRMILREQVATQSLKEDREIEEEGMLKQMKQRIDWFNDYKCKQARVRQRPDVLFLMN